MTKPTDQHASGHSEDCAGCQSNTALRSTASHARLWLVAAFGLVADLWSKHWAFTHLDSGKGEVIVSHLARFQRSLNTGALFGLGKGWTPLFILASVLALGFVFYLFAHSGRERWSLHVALGLVLAGALGNLYDRAFEIADVVKYSGKTGGVYIEAGLINEEESNEKYLVLGSYPEGKTRLHINRESVIDTWQQGVVRDFIKMEPQIPIGKDRRLDVWPWVFNIADVLLVVGVALLMLNFWKERRAARSGKDAAESQADKSGSDS